MPIAAAAIPNGWGEKRFVFMLKIEQIISEYSRMVHYMSGYSEFYDLSYGGHIDDNMLFYINNIVTITVNDDPVSRREFISPATNTNVVYDHKNNDGMLNAPDAFRLIRPKDVVSDLHLLEVMHGQNTYGSFNYGDLLTTSSLSRCANSNPVSYFTNTVNSFISAKNISDGYNDIQDILVNATSKVNDGVPLENEFIRELSRLTNTTSTTAFSLNDLMSIDPTLRDNSKDRIQVFEDGGVVNKSSYLSGRDPMGVANVTQPTEYNTLACTIMHSIISILTECMVTKLVANCSNEDGEHTQSNRY